MPVKQRLEVYRTFPPTPGQSIGGLDKVSGYRVFQVQCCRSSPETSAVTNSPTRSAALASAIE